MTRRSSGSVTCVRHNSERLPHLIEYARTHKVLHIGAGRGGFGTTLDISPAVNPHILADLSEPLPIPDDSYDAVYAFSILEHITNLVPLIEELHRIVRRGGFLAILVPHFSAAALYVDPTHVRGFSVRTFDYFVEGSSLEQDFGWYSDIRFIITTSLLTFQSPIVNRLVASFLNKHAHFYEDHLAYVIRGAGIYWEFEVVK